MKWGLEFWLGCAGVSFLVWLHYRLRKHSFMEGEKNGYQRGFQEGHTAADNWWMNWEHEVTRTQKSIQNEERWP